MDQICKEEKGLYARTYERSWTLQLRKIHKEMDYINAKSPQSPSRSHKKNKVDNYIGNKRRQDGLQKCSVEKNEVDRTTAKK